MLRRIALLAAALALSAAPGAQADGDPASDVLPTLDVFYPYSPPASKPLVEALDGLLASVRKAGYPMKVALIASPTDLGAYPTMFNHPQEYANLLASELPTNPHGKVKDDLHLLIVMPAGFGGVALGDRVDEALAPVEVDAEASTDGLVRAAIHAVARIATVNGRETPVPPEATASGDGDDSGGIPKTPALIVIGVIVVLLLVALVVVRRRSRPSDDRPQEEPEAQENGEEARTT